MSDLELKVNAADNLDRFGFRSSRKTRSGQSGESDNREQDALFGMFAVLLIAITFFQKVGFVTGSGAVFPLIVPAAFATLGYGLFRAQPILRIGRVMGFLAAFGVLLFSTAVFAPAYSPTSLVLLAALYVPFVVTFRTEQKTYLRCMRFFSTLMIVFAAIVWVQHALQLTIGWRAWPNLDELLPAQLLIPEFNYIQPIRYGMDYMKPSGIFFLEVSTLSQFLTLAIVVEVIFFKRWWRAAFLGATVFATFAGTGLLLLIVAMPLLFVKMTPRAFVGALITVLIILYAAVQLNWFDMAMSRVDEFGKVGSSASSRFVEPLYRMASPLARDTGLYAGVGPGQIESGGNIFWWPITKLSVEYGLIEALVFYGFLFYCLFDGAVSRRLVFVVAVWYSFEGTLLTAYNPLACVLLITMFYVPARSAGLRANAAPIASQSMAAP